MIEGKHKYKNAIWFVMALLLIAVIGGLFTGIYTFAGFTEDIKQQLLPQLGGLQSYVV